MKKRILISAGVIVALVLGATGIAVATGINQPAVTVRVVDAADEQPVVGAIVRLQNDTTRRDHQFIAETTDENGEVRWTGQTASHNGRYYQDPFQFTAVKDGYTIGVNQLTYDGVSDQTRVIKLYRK